MKYYQLLPINVIEYSHGCDKPLKYKEEIVKALSIDIHDAKYQWIFEPIEVVRYKQGGRLRSKTGPFIYQLTGGLDRFCTIKKLGLHHIRAHIDTTFSDDGQDKANPFPKNWRENLGHSTTVEAKRRAKELKQMMEIEAMDRRIRKWMRFAIAKGYIKKEISNPARVAVILTSYNRPTLVQKAINSVLEQSYRSFKLYIIDNNSHPSVKIILRKYATKHPDKIVLHFLKTPNNQRLARCWLSYMINWAIRKGKEKYITLLTDDCWFTRNRLLHMVHYLDKHPKAMIIYGTQIVVNRQGKHLKQRPANKVISPKMGACVIDHNQIMFRRKLITKVGFWNESPHPANINAPDAEFFRRIPYPMIPIPVVTDFNLFHKRRFQRFYERDKTRLKSGEFME